MGKCITTVLQENIGNDSIERLGEMKLVAKNVTNGGQGIVAITSDADVQIRVVGNTAFTNEARTTGQASNFSFGAGTTRIWLNDGDAEVYVKSKYEISRVAVGSSLTISIEDLAYVKEGFIVAGYASRTKAFLRGNLDSLAKRTDGSIVFEKLSNGAAISFIGVSGSLKNVAKFDVNFKSFSTNWNHDFADSDITGDISVYASFSDSLKQKLTDFNTYQGNVGKIYGNLEAFKDYTNMVSFNPNYIKTTGNFATACGKMTRLTLIAVGDHKEAEDLKNLFDTLHANGKISGSIKCWMGSNKTLNGGAWTNGKTVTFSASGWTVS